MKFFTSMEKSTIDFDEILSVLTELQMRKRPRWPQFILRSCEMTGYEDVMLGYKDVTNGDWYEGVTNGDCLNTFDWECYTGIMESHSVKKIKIIGYVQHLTPNT